MWQHDPLEDDIYEQDHQYQLYDEYIQALQENQDNWEIKDYIENGQ